MGAFAGVGAMTGLVELRPTPDICAAKCRDGARLSPRPSTFTSCSVTACE